METVFIKHRNKSAHRLASKSKHKLTKFGLAGTPQFTVNIAEALIAAGHIPSFILTRKDKPAGRGQHITPSPMRALAAQYSIPCIATEKIDAACLKEIQRHSIEALIISAFGLMLPQKLLQQISCVNLHTSLLPLWRGAAPIERAIEAGDPTSGITLMRVTDQLDAGPILMQKSCPLEEEDTAASLTVKLQALAIEALKEFLRAPNHFKERAQDDNQASYAAKISPAEAVLDWTEPAETLARKIRAFNPSPGCRTDYQGRLLKIWMAKPIHCEEEAKKAQNKTIAGTIIKRTQQSIWIDCGQGCLAVSEIQFAGKKKMPVSAANNLPKVNECLGGGLN